MQRDAAQQHHPCVCVCLNRLSSGQSSLLYGRRAHCYYTEPNSLSHLRCCCTSAWLTDELIRCSAVKKSSILMGSCTLERAMSRISAGVLPAILERRLFMAASRQMLVMSSPLYPASLVASASSLTSSRSSTSCSTPW